MTRLLKHSYLTIMVAVALLLALAGCGSSDRVVSGGPAPEDTATVVFKFKLALASRTMVPAEVTSYSFEGYAGEERLVNEKRDKDEVKEDGQEQAVTLTNVPIAVDHFVISYLTEDGTLGSAHQDVTLEAGGYYEYEIDGPAVPTQEVSVTLKNCYTDFPEGYIPSKVNVKIVHSSGELEFKDLDYNADGLYEVSVKMTAPLAVSSAVVSNAEDDIPFEWLSYSEPQTGTELTLDVTENEFANGKFAEGTVMEVANPRQLNNVRNHLGADYKQVADIDFAGSCGIEISISSTTDGISANVENPKPGARFYRFDRTDEGKDLGWRCIGEVKSNAFTGSYDGQKFKIANLQASRPEDDSALFGVVEGATLKNICVADSCAVVSPNASLLCADVKGNSTVSSCTVAGILCSGDGGGSLASMVSFDYSEQEVRIEECASSADCYFCAENSCGGGLISWLSCPGEGNLYLNKCSFKGTITSFHSSNIGGLVGDVSTGMLNLMDCAVDMNYSSLSPDEHTEQHIGGMVGNVAPYGNLIMKSVNTVEGTLGFDNSNVMYAGGVLGYSDSFTGGVLKETFKDVQLNVDITPDTDRHVHKYSGYPSLDSLD